MKLGACLADDMGLGKTVQVLAFLDALKAEAKRGKKAAASLLIIPASLLANWVSEIERFAPGLAFFVAHPDFHRPAAVPALTAKSWTGWTWSSPPMPWRSAMSGCRTTPGTIVILDEAQAIKNPGTKQTRAVKKICSANRIIMTGTPVENKLSDLWSLFDFINPGLLGNCQGVRRVQQKDWPAIPMATLACAGWSARLSSGA